MSVTRRPPQPLIRSASRLLALFAVLLCAPLHAETYRMDLIVFADRGGSGEAPSSQPLPNLAGALAPDSAAALQAAGITVLPDTQFGLQTEWQRLRNSKRFAPLARIAWTQRDPLERGPGLRLRVGSAEAPTLDGRVTMLIVNRYLTLDADLVHDSGAGLYRLNERRKMRRDELHHLDAAKLGIVARVSKVETGGGSP